MYDTVKGEGPMDFHIKSLLMELALSLQRYGYSGVAISTFLEGVSIPFPSIVILLLAGFLASKGSMSLFSIIIIAAASYTIGSCIPYYIGHSMNKGLLNILNKYIKIPQKHVESTRSLFNKYGEIAVCFTRPTLLGNYISYFAGINKMPLARFLSYTFIGILPWAAVIVFIGSKLGSSFNNAYNTAARYMAYFNIALFAAFLVFIIMKRKNIYSFIMNMKKRD